MKNDFFARIRSTMMANLQVSMRSVREFMKMSPKQLGEILGLPESKIKNLEQNIDSITELEYVALCGLIDNQMRQDKQVEQNIKKIMKIEDEEAISLLDRWMMVFDEEEEEDEEEKIVEGQEIDEEAMKLLAENYKVFLNYDSLKLCRDNEKFFELLKEMKKFNNTFIVPLRAVDKLQNDMLSFRDIKEVKRAMSLLNRLKESNDIILKGDETDGTVEEVILKVFGAFKSRYQMALLTENETLAKQLQAMNQYKDGNEICVIMLKDNGMKVYDALTEEEKAALAPEEPEVVEEPIAEEPVKVKMASEEPAVIEEDSISEDDIEEIDMDDEEDDDTFRIVDEDDDDMDLIQGDELDDEIDLVAHLTSDRNKGVQNEETEEDLFKTITPDKKVKKQLLDEAEDFPDLSHIDLGILDIEEDDDEEHDDDEDLGNDSGWGFA